MCGEEDWGNVAVSGQSRLMVTEEKGPRDAFEE